MAKMEYVTPGITKIDFEDSLFVTTKLDGDENKEVKSYIKSRGGFIGNSVTKTTNYLIYRDGKEETTKYKKAMELIRDKDQKITVLPLSLFYAAAAGEGTMEFGRYPFEADGTEKPIRWIILKREEKKALLLSAYGLDAKPYNEKLTGVTWETCTLRSWLNGEFYDKAFSEEEKCRIPLTKLQNEDNPKYNTPGGNDTEDRIFLLSLNEAEKYLPGTMARRRKPTPFAIENGAYESWNGHCWWWLRSPGISPSKAAGVNSGGDVGNRGYDVGLGDIAVCPALWIETESDA